LKRFWIKFFWQTGIWSECPSCAKSIISSICCCSNGIHSHVNWQKVFSVKQSLWKGFEIHWANLFYFLFFLSFVIGFGNNYPTHPHHRSSSCPDAPATCDWNNYNSPNPNPQLLYGALVGGPAAANDQYIDVRSGKRFRFLQLLHKSRHLKLRPCKTGKFSLRPYQNNYGN